MTALCITGAQTPELKAVESLLLHAGMAPAKAVQRQTSIDFAAWHKQVLGSDQLSRWNNGTNPSIGRLWEQVAGDLFLANMGEPQWGWAESQSAALLDYWAGFDSSVRFLLICQSPEQAILEQLAVDASRDDIEAKLSEWHDLHTAMLEFHQRQPSRSLMVWAESCTRQPASLLKHCAQRWRLKLDPACAPLSDIVESGRLISVLGNFIAGHFIDNHPATQQLKEHLSLCMEKLEEQGTHKDSQEVNLLHRLLDEYRSLQSGSFHAPENLAEQTLHDDALQSQLHEAQQENASLKEKLEATVAALDSASRDLAEQRETHDAIIDALRQSQEENASRLAEEIQARNILLSQREVDTQRQSDASARIRDVVQENDLLLSQLHQVQEALDECLRQNQDAQNQLLLANARWQRMLKRNPLYSDFERIDRLQAGSGPDQRLMWRVYGLTIGARIINQLDFSTVVEGGMAGVVFSKEAANSGALLRWPGLGEQSDEVLILPRGDKDVIRTRAATIEELSTSDAQLVWRVPALLLPQLNEGEAPLAAALKGLQEAARRIVVPLRYDEVVLKREQVNPDYEHLWFVLKNTEIHGHHHGDLEFRLGCADVHGGNFGSKPKLEFPQSTSTALEKWYAESNDDFGLKLELRFLLPNQFDIGVWKSLSQHDQQLIKALLRAVPRIISSMTGNGIQFKREPELWQNMAVQMVRALTIQSNPLLPQRATTTEADKPQDTAPTEAPIAVPAPKAYKASATKKSKSSATASLAKLEPATPAPEIKPVSKTKRRTSTAPAA
ncbi:hypothetical protein [Azohydromonas lata]|uniref:Uncharacterized protein n=1 Tax=Azohydromonas lata TaxID=45677 RepID=A0ABU5IN81_9BURK|nr:hypothetical protein [Azohydromonas lata]MDZ5460319.1 hypothetical protein [Azohydromonas lata]